MILGVLVFVVFLWISFFKHYVNLEMQAREICCGRMASTMKLCSLLLVFGIVCPILFVVAFVIGSVSESGFKSQYSEELEYLSNNRIPRSMSVKKVIVTIIFVLSICVCLFCVSKFSYKGISDIDDDFVESSDYYHIDGIHDGFIPVPDV